MTLKILQHRSENGRLSSPVAVGKRSHDRCTVYQIYVDAAVVSLLPTSAFFGILSGGRRHWAAALKSGHAVQRKRCGSLNRSFSYRGSRPAPPNPSSDPREASPGTSQATGGSLQALIGGAPVPSRIQLFQRNGVAIMERVLRRPLGRAFSSKILGMKVKS